MKYIGDLTYAFVELTVITGCFFVILIVTYLFHLAISNGISPIEKPNE